MDCTEVAAILDTHRSRRLAAAERAAVDMHLSDCDDCAAAWLAQSELLALRVPPMPTTLPQRALLASRAPQSAEPRRARMPIVMGSVLLAGAALAAGVTIVTMTREQSVPRGTAPDVERSAAPAAPGATLEPVTPADAAPATPPGDGVTSVELVETALSIVPLVRHNPQYPARALARGVEGQVQVKFDVTAAGVVENVSVVESSDAQFEDATVEAVAQWRYLPRIAAGKRVATEGVRTVIRFALQGDQTPPNPRQDREAEAQRESLVFSAGLKVALDRLAADDLRGAELQLDEVQAVHGAAYGQLWNFYGYLFTVQGNYDRAIDSYETAVSAFSRNGTPREAPYVPLANLYFARHQYDMALKTLLRPNLPGGNRVMSPEADALAQKLNALGVTAETLQ